MFTEGHVPGLEGGVTLSYGSKSVMTERVNILYDTIKEHSRMDQGLLSSPGIQPMPRPQGITGYRACFVETGQTDDT